MKASTKNSLSSKQPLRKTVECPPNENLSLIIFFENKVTDH
jgi:hypothetical protein